METTEQRSSERRNCSPKMQLTLRKGEEGSHRSGLVLQWCDSGTVIEAINTGDCGAQDCGHGPLNSPHDPRKLVHPLQGVVFDWGATMLRIKGTSNAVGNLLTLHSPTSNTWHGPSTGLAGAPQRGTAGTGGT